MTTCERCGETNPAEIHTCTPNYVDRRQWKYDPMTGKPLVDDWPFLRHMFCLVFMEGQMTITLTREEAQQVLDAFLGIGQRAYDAMSGDAFHECSIAVSRLRFRLSAPQPEYRDVVIKGDLWRIEFLPDHAASVVLVRANYEAQSEPEPVAWNCAADLADASICKSWCGNSNCISHIAPSKPESEYESQPEPEPVADKYLMEVECTKCGAKQDGVLTVTSPPQCKWQGLTDEEISELIRNTHNTGSFVRAIEVKLKQKNA